MSKKLLTDLIVDRFVNLELFYRKQQTTTNDCVEWQGPKNNAGYGFIGFRPCDPATGEPGKTRMMTVHRLAWMIANKRMPVQPNINHTCHNKLCVNPAHLTNGTQQDKLKEMRDAGIKGGCQKGKKYGPRNQKQERTYKYTEEEIQFIRSRSTPEIMERYGVDKKRASCMRWGFRKGYTWLPVPELTSKLRPGRKPQAK